MIRIRAGISVASNEMKNSRRFVVDRAIVSRMVKIVVFSRKIRLRIEGSCFRWF